MKNHFLLVPLFSLLASPVFSQRTLKETDENKYRIKLPDHWTQHSKAFHVLTDVLPTLCPELKDKDICGDDCNPAWTVEMYITEPVMLTQSVYSKPAFADNTNTQTAAVRRDQLVSYSNPQPSEINNNLMKRQVNNNGSGRVHVIYYTFECFLLLVDQEQKITTRLILVDTNEIWEKTHTYSTGTPASFKLPSPDSPSMKKLMPATKELLAIADKKILALGKTE